MASLAHGAATLSTILTAVMAVAALATALAAWMSVRRTAKNTAASLFSRLMEEYGSKEMKHALQTLRKVGEAFSSRGRRDLEAWPPGEWAPIEAPTPDQFRDEVDNQYGAPDPECDNARRRVKFFFMRAYWYGQSGALGKTELEHVVKLDGMRLFGEHVLKMDRGLLAQSPLPSEKTKGEPHPDSLPSVASAVAYFDEGQFRHGWWRRWLHRLRHRGQRGRPDV